MKRNMDLVRLIMLKLNEHEHGNAPRSLDIEGYSEEEIGYHCFIMNEAGLIEASDITTMASLSPDAMPLRLTWNGHEFIENAQNEKVWSETKQTVSKLVQKIGSIYATFKTLVLMSAKFYSAKVSADFGCLA